MTQSNSCGLLIKQINDEMRKQANNAMRSQDMTMSQSGALLELNRAPEKQRSLKELEQSLHVAQSTVVGIISRLEQKGLVESFGDATDRRIKLVRITSAGQECVAGAEKHMEEAEKHLLSALTETEREIFYVLLQKVRNSLQ
ncbi:MAG: MarR family transcriptional regulator [Oscillospiraceae bacterium]|nr:MarR family transcriptional regulator [Oscillospiraceae bacterium]